MRDRNYIYFAAMRKWNRKCSRMNAAWNILHSTISIVNKSTFLPCSTKNAALIYLDPPCFGLIVLSWWSSWREETTLILQNIPIVPHGNKHESALSLRAGGNSEQALSAPPCPLSAPQPKGDSFARSLI